MQIFPRYDPAGITEYYAGDFLTVRPDGPEWAMWVDEFGRQVVTSPFQHAEVVGGGLDPWPSISWSQMDKGCFDRIMEDVTARFHPEDFEHRPFALGVILSPPKGVSLPALAGPSVESRIIQAHRGAVDFVARLLLWRLVTRRNKEDVGIRGRILRFAHPFSRANDPQLHDHLEWIPDPEDGPLHTYPWFFFQHALWQIYHFCLAADLVSEGFGIEVTDPEELRWELSGVDRNQMELFSKRSQEIEMFARGSCRESLSSAVRWAALTSSRFWPKFPEATLGDARKNWMVECPRDRCAVRAGGRREKRAFLMPEMERLFQKSSRAHLLTLQGRALALRLGQVCDPLEAMKQVDLSLLQEFQRGNLLMEKIRSSRAYLLPGRYREEKTFLKLLARGLGKGTQFSLREPVAGLDPRIKSALMAPNRLRLVSAKVPKPKIPLVATGREGSELSLVPLPAADVRLALKETIGNEKGDTLVSCESPLRNGDFLAYAQAFSLMRGFDPPDPRQRNVTLVKGVGYSKTIVHVEVRAGALPRDPEVAWMELENRRAEQGAVCLVPPDYPDQLRRDVNMAMAGRLIRSRPPEEASELIALDLLVPQAEAREGMEWVVFANHRNYLLRTRWKVCKVHPDGSMTLAKTRAERTLTAANISSLKHYLSFVERRRIQVVCGMRLHVETSFSQRKPSTV